MWSRAAGAEYLSSAEMDTSKVLKPSLTRTALRPCWLRGFEFDIFAISTGPRFVYLDYKKPTMRPLTRVTAFEAKQHLDAGQFPDGSMGPKVDAALRFLRSGGSEVIITSYQYLSGALAGTDGTHIFSDREPSGQSRATISQGDPVHAK